MAETKHKIKVLFLCTGNSCRSQIAEGWARHLKSDVIEAYSAGIRPIGVNSKAIKVMAEAGVDISMQTPKHIDTLLGIDFGYVVTLCDDAREHCPVLGDLAFYAYRDMESCDWTPFTKAAVERNPVSIKMTESMSTEQVYD